MADYREITQEYAKGTIKTVILINAGAAIATVNQIEQILKFTGVVELRVAILMWVIGIVLGALTWGFAYLSTIEFGNYHDTDGGGAHWNRGNDRAVLAGRLMIASLGCFVLGCLSIVFPYSLWMPEFT